MARRWGTADASLFSPRTWPAEPRACGLPWAIVGTSHQRNAPMRADEWRSSGGSRPARGRSRHKCRLRTRSARSRRDDICRSPEPRPATFVDTGPVPSDAPPRNVASITAMNPEGSGVLAPGLRLVGGAIELPDHADRFQQPGARPQAGLALAGLPTRRRTTCPPRDPRRSPQPRACRTRGDLPFAQLDHDRAATDHQGASAVIAKGRGTGAVHGAGRWPLKRWGPVPGDVGENGTHGSRR